MTLNPSRSKSPASIDDQNIKAAELVSQAEPWPTSLIDDGSSTSSRRRLEVIGTGCRYRRSGIVINPTLVAAFERMGFNIGELRRPMLMREMFVDGKRHGPAEAIDIETGDVLISTAYKNGKQHGEWRIWYPMIPGPTLESPLQGRCLCIIATLRDGRRVGSLKQFWPSGQRKSEQHYAMDGSGRFDGRERIFDRDGRTTRIRSFVKGTVIGYIEMIDDDTTALDYLSYDDLGQHHGPQFIRIKASNDLWSLSSWYWFGDELATEFCFRERVQSILQFLLDVLGVTVVGLAQLALDYVTETFDTIHSDSLSWYAL